MVIELHNYSLEYLVVNVIGVLASVSELVVAVTSVESHVKMVCVHCISIITQIIPDDPILHKLSQNYSSSQTTNGKY
jgi:hypothetical protein